MTPPLFAHQREAVAFAGQKPRCAIYYDTGTGKTRVGLEILRAAPRQTRLVICPLSIVRPAWVRDAAQFAPELGLTPIIHYDKRKRTRMLLDAVGAGRPVIMGFEAALTLQSSLRAIPWDHIIVDESSKLRNWSKTTKLITSLCTDAKRVTLFSGCPAPNDALDFFYQMQCVDPTLFGTSFTKFRVNYARALYQVAPYVWVWEVGPEQEKQILDKVASVAIWKTKDDCLDLPGITEETWECPLTAFQQGVYDDILNDAVTTLAEGVVRAPNPLTRVMRLRQICSGHVPTENAIVDLPNRRLSSVRDLLDYIGPKEQVVIWCEFTHEMDAIAKLLGEFRCGQLRGERSLDERDRDIERFRTGEVQYMICHPKAAGMGLTLIEASNAIYVSQSWSYEDYRQSRDRIYRAGQTRPVTIHRIMAPGTVEEEILAALDAKESFEDRAVAWVQKQGDK